MNQFGIAVVALAAAAGAVQAQAIDGVLTGGDGYGAPVFIQGVQTGFGPAPNGSELGAIYCRPAPLCPACPLRATCAWRGDGEDPAPARRPQKFAGTDRQARGRIMAYLRDAEWAARPLLITLATVSDDDAQAARALDSLVSDGLVTEVSGAYRLGG